jgi:hypothetical protein
MDTCGACNANKEKGLGAAVSGFPVVISAKVESKAV